MRKFVDDHSNQKQNEMTAWLHIIMIGSMFFSTTIASLLRIFVNISDFFNTEEERDDYKKNFMAGNLLNIVG